jgi:hypothetical protein
MEDLAQAIKEWKELGDHIIIGMDANQGVHKGTVHTIFEGLGLREAIFDKHSNKSPPQCKIGHQMANPRPYLGVCLSIQ